MKSRDRILWGEGLGEENLESFQKPMVFLPEVSLLPVTERKAHEWMEMAKYLQ